MAGFTGKVTLTAAITSSPSGAKNPPSLSFGSTNPVSISGMTSGTAVLTIITTAPGTLSALNRSRPPNHRWVAVGGAALACVLLFGVPARRLGWKGPRSWMNKIGLVLLLSGLVAGLASCGVSNGGNPGTTAGAYQITITGTSGSTTATSSINLTVE